jgi:hypothetical protein
MRRLRGYAKVHEKRDGSCRRAAVPTPPPEQGFPVFPVSCTHFRLPCRTERCYARVEAGRVLDGGS